MREVTFVIILSLTACSALPAATNQPVTSGRQASHGFDQVPPADLAAAEKVDSVEGWKNPFLVVRPEGVELVTGGSSSGFGSVSVDRMRETLLSLPAEAWPLGRVVAVTELSIRSGKDDELIDRNRQALERMLTDLGVKISWWPTA